MSNKLSIYMDDTKVEIPVAGKTNPCQFAEGWSIVALDDNTRKRFELAGRTILKKNSLDEFHASEVSVVIYKSAYQQFLSEFRGAIDGNSTVHGGVEFGSAKLYSRYESRLSDISKCLIKKLNLNCAPRFEHAVAEAAHPICWLAQNVNEFLPPIEQIDIFLDKKLLGPEYKGTATYTHNGNQRNYTREEFLCKLYLAYLDAIGRPAKDSFRLTISIVDSRDAIGVQLVDVIGNISANACFGALRIPSKTCEVKAKLYYEFIDTNKGLDSFVQSVVDLTGPVPVWNCDDKVLRLKFGS